VVSARTGRGRAFLVERLGREPLQRLAAEKRVPIHRFTLFYFLGGMALFLFVIQIVTGILLALHYRPAPDEAFESVRTIMTELNFGWLIRSAHAWSANLLIGVLMLHLLTTYIMRAYRRPRELTWASGVVLLGLFLAFGFSGYLLPWNRLAFFATRVGTALVGLLPVVGGQLLLWARSGKEVTGETLAQFYAFHVVILPLATLAVLGVHLYLVQHHGMSIPQTVAKERGAAENVPSMAFFPKFLLRDMVGWYVALGLLAALAALSPWELGEKADPFGTPPEGIRPEWYFLFMYESLRQLPPRVLGIEWLNGDVVGVLLAGLAGLVVLLVPLLDWRAAQGWSRPVLNFLAAWAVAAFLIQTAGGLGLLELRLARSALFSGLAAVALWLTWLMGTRLHRSGRLGRDP